MVSIKVVLKKKKLSDGKYPIFLRITQNRRSIFFRTPYTCCEKEWNAKQGKFNNKATDYLNKNRLILKFQDRATSVVTTLEQEKDYYTLGDIEERLRMTTNPDLKKLYPLWLEIMDELRLAGRYGSARIHQEGLKSLQKYCKLSELLFYHVTFEFLEKYEAWLRSRGGTDGGIGIKMRSIRTLFNVAINRKRIAEDIYPFKIYKLSKLKGRGIKKAICIEDIHKIKNLDLIDYPTLVDTRNYFIFSFYTRGMNFADMVTLKWSDISKDRIYYSRAKTKKNFHIKILPPVQDILQYYWTNKNETGYVFPVLWQNDMTPNHIENRKQKILKRYNKRLKEIAKLCEIEKPLTSYVARHSYANCLKQKGIATDIISESMGHQNVAITQAYLKELDSTVIDEAVEVLL